MEEVRNPTYLGDLLEEQGDLESRLKHMEKENKYKLIAQQKRESTLQKMTQDGAPKSLFRIKELQDKLASVKEGIKREAASKARFHELLKHLGNQESLLRSKEAKCLRVAQQHAFEFTDLDETPALKAQEAEHRRLKQEKEKMDKQMLHSKLEQTLTQKKADMQFT